MPQYGKLTHPRPPPDPDGIELNGLGDVQREMAKVYRDMRKSRVNDEVGARLVNALNCIAGLMQDARDSKWLPRVKEMWAEREREAAKLPPDPSPPVPH